MVCIQVVISLLCFSSLKTVCFSAMKVIFVHDLNINFYLIEDLLFIRQYLLKDNTIKSYSSIS